MAKFSDMLTFLRKRANLSQQALAEITGLTRSAIGMYESGQRKPDFETMEVFADYFNVSMDTLMGRDGTESQRPALATSLKPRLGTIACGTPLLAEQNIECYDEVPDFIKCDFTLICKGDSMIGARIHDGDVVCIKQNIDVENGQIAAVMVDDGYSEGATLKRVRYIKNGVSLWPENPAYEPMIFTGTDVDNVKILGRATHFISAIK